MVQACLVKKEAVEDDAQLQDVTDASPGLSDELVIGDTDRVTCYYYECFNVLQQAACKIIAKAWVKAKHPRKQSTHPYRGNSETRPEWWPATVLHKEPDHMKKPGRVELLIHMLRLEDVTIEMLEKVTDELVNAPVVANRSMVLREIYKVAKMEKRYSLQEIDEHTTVFIKSPSHLKSLISDEEKERSLHAGDIEPEEENSDVDDEMSTSQGIGREFRGQSMVTIIDQQEEQTSNESIRHQGPSFCGLNTSDFQLYRDTGTSNLFPSAYFQATSPMDPSSFVVPQSSSNFTSQPFFGQPTLSARSSGGAQYIETFQAMPMNEAGCQSASSSFMSAPFIPHPPTVPSQPGNMIRYLPLAPGNADVQSVQEDLLGFMQGQRVHDLTTVPSAMASNQFGQEALMGAGSTENLDFLQEVPAGYGHYPMLIKLEATPG
ncbi:MAG: hypothetical protein M1816_003209 [Peltula sp. TS41687]|nr:MAG: hypothetical protein M1816_003209 [Peltula sp. TS41687]